MSIDFDMAGNSTQGAGSRFLSWWFDELSACITARNPQHRHWKTLLIKTAKGINIYSRNADGVSKIGSVSKADFDAPGPVPNTASMSEHLNKKNTILRLGKDQVLQHEMQIPTGARDVIGPIVRNKLERIVPWPASQMCFGYLVTDGKAGAEHVDVKAVATSRKILDEALAHAKRLNIEPDSIEFSEQPKAETGIAFIGTRRDNRQKVAGRIAAIMAVTLILSTAAGAAGLVRMFSLGSELKAQEATLSDSRLSAAEVRRQRNENVALVQQRNHIIEKRKVEPAVVVALEALSKALPDNSYLTKLEFQDRLVRLSGTSTDAAALINRLETSPQFYDVSFSAPTTRQFRNNTESFSISAKLEVGARMREAQ